MPKLSPTNSRVLFQCEGGKGNPGDSARTLPRRSPVPPQTFCGGRTTSSMSHHRGQVPRFCLQLRQGTVPRGANTFLRPALAGPLLISARLHIGKFGVTSQLSRNSPKLLQMHSLVLLDFGQLLFLLTCFALHPLRSDICRLVLEALVTIESHFILFEAASLSGA